MYNFRKNLVGRLQASGCSVVAVGADLDGYELRLRDGGVDFRTVPVPMSGFSPLGDLKLFWAFFRIFRRVRPQVAHMFTIKPVIYGTLAAAAAGVPRRICTVTGLGHAFTESGGLVRFVRIIAEVLYRVALSQAHVVFFQNEDDRELFISRRLVAADKARMVPGSGVDLDRFQPPPGPRPARPVRFLMVTRLIRDKGVMEFVEAAERLAAAGLDVDFRLLGSEDARNPTRLTPEEIVRLRASPVKWLGGVEDVRPALAEADVVVLPSYYREGTPRVLLEAMAMGKPIVTTDAPGCRHLVEPGVNGYLTPVRNASALAEAMARCAASLPDLERMGQAARRFVELNYSETVVLDRCMASYAPWVGETAPP